MILKMKSRYLPLSLVKLKKKKIHILTEMCYDFLFQITRPDWEYYSVLSSSFKTSKKKKKLLKMTHHISNFSLIRAA